VVIENGGRSILLGQACRVPAIWQAAERHRPRGAVMTAPRPASSDSSASSADQRAAVPGQRQPGDPVRPGQPGGPEAAGGPAGRFVADAFGPLGSQAWLAVLTVAVLTLAVGVLLLAWPKATLTVVAILLGAGLVISGLFRLVEGFTARDASGGTRAAYVLIGLIAILVGLYCLRHHDVTVFLLALLVGAFWIVHGVADLAAAATSGRTPGRGLRVVAGLFSIAAGAVVLFWPGISLVLMLTILGAWLIFYAVILGLLAFRLRRWAKSARRAAHSSPVPA
jgi:uncharacterized membrane protein HdeD (DUF308 family)